MLPNTESDFPGLPPFPSDVPTAPLVRLSLQRLRTSTEESGALFDACQKLGFFYLDLRGDEAGEKLLNESSQLFGVGRELFDLGREELDRFDYKSLGSYFGYKGFGKGVVNAKGDLDWNEFYNAGKDDFLDQSVTPFAHPSVLMENKLLLQSYTRNSHAIVTLLLELLNTHLQLPPNTLPSLHALPTISGDQIRFIKSPPQPPSDLRTAMGAHTDFGSLTILFNRLGGLQVLLPGQTAWSYVRPLPGHAIINLGDAMVKFSGGVLRSNIHRVVSPPREQGSETRYAIVYFARPGDGVAMKRLEGGIVPGLKEGETEEEDVSAAEWIVDKAMARRAGVYEGERIGKARVTNEEELRQEVLAS